MGIEAPDLNDYEEDEKEGFVASIGKFVEQANEMVKPMMEEIDKKKRHKKAVLVSQFEKCIRSVKQKEFKSEKVNCKSESENDACKSKSEKVTCI